MLKLFRFAKPYKKQLIWAVILTLVGNVMTLLLPLLMSKIVNNGINAANIDEIKRTGLIMLGVSAISVLISVACSYFSSIGSVGFGAEMRRAVFTKVETLSECDVEKIGTPSLITRCTNDVNRIQDLMLTGLRIIITAPIMLVGGIVMSVMLNPKLSSSMIVIFPIVFIIAYLMKKKVMPLFSVEQKKTDALNKILREKLTGIRVIRAFNKTKHEDERFSKANIELTDIALYIGRLFAGLIPIALMLVFIFIVAVVWIGSNQINALDSVTQAQQIQNMVGDLQAFVIYMILIVFSVSMAAAMIIMLPRAGISAARINEVLETETLIKEPENPEHFDEKDTGTLEYRNVSFGYPDAEKRVLEDISFKSEPGEVTAIIGGTGGGKSTFVNLIPRFFDVTDGEILVGGHNVRNLTLNELHSKIGFVPQKATLFSGTIADNIRFGRPDATDEEVWQALDIACASEFVRDLPETIDYEVTQNGTNLSGGQRQRLAIARAIVSKADIFVFDDSFSALDFATDAQVRRNIRAHLKNANVIIVAQRVGTVMDADRIIVLDEGRVNGIGTHSELMESCEVYREIVNSQLTQEDLAQ